MSYDTSDGFDRRTLLDGVTAGTPTAPGAAGIASAAGTVVHGTVSDEYVDQYGDVESVSEIVAERQDALETLVENGYLDEASVDALDFEEVATGRPEDVPEGAAAVTEHDTADGVVAAIHVPVESNDGRARLTVVPEQDRAVIILPGEGAVDTFRNAGTSAVEACGGESCDCCSCRRFCDVRCWTECECC